jgi:uncharacterized protein (DUF1501 family)
MNFRLAAHLLTHPEYPARYVGIMDGGIQPASDAGGYDTHSNNCDTQSRNLFNTLRVLASVINDKSAGESDPAKLDLDRTLIVINTEFGRTPHVEGQAGRGHWPYAYPVAFLGGPVRTPSIYGSLAADFTAEVASTPTMNRMAVLMALGIWPFAPESFNVADVPGTLTESAGAARVRKDVLGAK